jgi:hypothetical protein
MITSSNNDNLQGVVPTQKQEWVTPKILLMGAEHSEGNKNTGSVEGINAEFNNPYGNS